jgi:hypothetical protein
MQTRFALPNSRSDACRRASTQLAERRQRQMSLPVLPCAANSSFGRSRRSEARSCTRPKGRWMCWRQETALRSCLFMGPVRETIFFPILERTLIEDGFRLIVLNRPGNFGTPLSCGRTPQEHADLGAELLDRLNIERVAVFGTSGGGVAAPHVCRQASGANGGVGTSRRAVPSVHVAPMDAPTSAMAISAVPISARVSPDSALRFSTGDSEAAPGSETSPERIHGQTEP